MPDMMNIQEAAGLMGLHRETLRQHAAAGRIPALKVGGCWRFRRQSLDDWLTGEEQKRMRKHVLIVEDEKHVRDPVRTLLENAGHEVTAAGTGEEALAELATIAPDLAILDLHLPGVSGVDVLRELRQRCSTARVIILTGYPDSELLQPALAVAPVMMLAKPVHPRKLLEAVSTVLGKEAGKQISNEASSVRTSSMATAQSGGYAT